MGHPFLRLAIPLSDYTTIYFSVLLFPVWTIMREKKKANRNLLGQGFMWPCALISPNARTKFPDQRVGVCLTLLDIIWPFKRTTSFFILKVMHICGKVSIRLRIITVKICCLLCDRHCSKYFKNIRILLTFTASP